ncbi:hypothetical protein M0802_010262 [Mischocyttarus mexicanus]|nr:hypothetical protein M0802_010262 [Mischocyttarus mexicanus]
MEKKDISGSKRKICVIELTSDDENSKASTSSCKPQIKKTRIKNTNKAPLAIHMKNIRYKYRMNSLKNIVKKVQIKKVDLSKVLDDDKNTVLYTNSAKVEKENISTNSKIPNTTSLSKCVDTENITVLYSKCNATNQEISSTTSSTNLDTEEIIDSLSNHNVTVKNLILTVPETNLDTENITVNNEEITSVTPPKNLDIKDTAYTEDIVISTINNPKILMQEPVFYSELTNNNLEKDSSHINITSLINEILNGENFCRFYWLDAYENQSERHVYLFGKVYIDSTKTSYSSCLTIKSISRKIYVLPTKCNSLDGETKVTTKEDVLKEFDKLANNFGIHEFQSRWVNKKYVFQKDISDNEEYLEITYPAMYRSIHPDYTGPAIDKIFQVNLSPLQLLLLERNIKGPCWLNINDPITDLSRTSWSRINLICENIENISVSVLSSSESLPLPPIVIATINTCTYLEITTKKYQVLMVVIVLKDEYPFIEDTQNQPSKRTFCLITKPNNISWPLEVDLIFENINNTDVIKCQNETDLLEQLLNILEIADPDLYIGYDSNSQLELLLRRMFSLNITNWHKLGKLNNFKSPGFKDKIFLDQALPGRPICDLKALSLELNIKGNSLQSLSEQVLEKEYNQFKEIKSDISYQTYTSCYSSKKRLEDLIEFTVMKTRDILSIALKLNVISFVIELTRISGCYLSKLLNSGKITRNEFLLSHAFYANNYILPDSLKKSQRSRIKEPNYEGGLVLFPRTGFYDKLVLLMDFISLYPSIIIEYNLCLSTVPGATCTNYEDLKIPESNSELGVIPKEMYKLIEYRKKVKELMKLSSISPNLKVQYNNKQLALKLMANSLYGCLGSSNCKFYAKGLAALIASKGRKILFNTKSLIENMEHKVIYGDTDSVIIKTDLLDYDKVISIGNKIKEEVKKSFKYLKLDIDSVFRYLLLLQKKRYAAIEMNKLPNGEIKLSQIHKGLLITRRDWCPLSVQVGKSILDIVLSDASSIMKKNAIQEILINTSRTINDNNTPLSSFVISKQLSKDLHDYHNNFQLHVQLAKRISNKSERILKMGDIVTYVICKNKPYHINELEENKSLKIDINYYLRKQLLPVILTLCEPVIDIDAKWIIKYLANKEELLTSNTDRTDKYNLEALEMKFLNSPTQTTIENIPSTSSNDLPLCRNDEFVSLKKHFPHKMVVNSNTKLHLQISSNDYKYAFNNEQE